MLSLGRSFWRIQSRRSLCPKKRKNGVKSSPEPVVIHPNAVGVDIGATEIFVAVPANRDEEPVRSFAPFTQDLSALADWLQRCGITTEAMESTGCTGFRSFRVWKLAEWMSVW